MLKNFIFHLFLFCQLGLTYTHSIQDVCPYWQELFIKLNKNKPLQVISPCIYTMDQDTITVLGLVTKFDYYTADTIPSQAILSANTKSHKEYIFPETLWVYSPYWPNWRVQTSRDSSSVETYTPNAKDILVMLTIATPIALWAGHYIIGPLFERAYTFKQESSI